MPRSRRLRARRFVGHLVVALAMGCLGQPTSFSPEQDDRAMAAIASSWSSAGATATLSLCEDLTVELGDRGCLYVHQVRGGGRGLRHEYEGGVGCGGCPLGTAAAVRGTLSSASTGGPVEVAGTIGLSNDDDPYNFPYSVHLQCVVGTCSVSGTLNEDGSLELDIDAGAGPGVEAVTLARTGAAACP